MAIINGYCTVLDLRAQLTDAGEKLDQTLMERAIGAASRAIDTYTRRRFWQDSSTSTRVFAVLAGGLVLVDDISTRDDLAVALGSDGITFPTTLTNDVDFVLEPRNADQYATATFGAYSFTNLRLLGSSGYASLSGSLPTVAVTARYGWSAVPDDVAEACILKAASLFKRKDAPFGVAGFGEFGAVRITRQDLDVTDLLDGYRFLQVA